jgi:hypothetical protein
MRSAAGACRPAFALGLGIAMMNLACATSAPANTPPAVLPAPSEISIVAQANTNRGTVLHVMATAVEAKASVGSYDEEAARFALSPADKSIVGRGLLLPGTSLKLPVKVPPEQALALAFFFTEPGATWRVVVPPPLPARLNIVLGTDGVDRLEADGDGH